MKVFFLTVAVTAAFFFAIFALTLSLHVLSSLLGLWFVVPLLLVCVGFMVYYIYLCVTEYLGK
jgi:hypothetical protein